MFVVAADALVVVKGHLGDAMPAAVAGFDASR